MVLIDKKFNEKQLLLETFFPKMYGERDIRKKLIFKFVLGLKPPLKKPNTRNHNYIHGIFSEERGLAQQL